MLLRADPEKGKVVGGVQVADSAPRLPRQLVDKASVLYCSGIIQGAANWDAYRVGSKDKQDDSVLTLINAHLTVACRILSLPSWLTTMTPVTPLCD